MPPYLDPCMSSKSTSVLSPVNLVVLVFTLLACFIVYLKVAYLHMPLQPGEESDVWTIEARIDFTGRNGPARVNFTLPQEAPGFTRLDENFVSRGFGLTFEESPEYREAIWTLRRSQGDQALFYRAQIYPETLNFSRPPEEVPSGDFPEVPDYPEPLASAVDDVLARARSESADIFTFASRLLAILSDPSDENVNVIHDARPQDEWVTLVTEIFAGARIPSRAIYGISLDNQFIDRPMITWL